MLSSFAHVLGQGEAQRLPALLDRSLEGFGLSFPRTVISGSLGVRLVQAS